MPPRSRTAVVPREETGAFRITPATRKRGADYAFEALAGAILNGELKPGDALPPQRELAERFDISTLVLRQAIHRLEDLGLLRVRQGSPAFVLDPEHATDIRLLQLRVELAPPGKPGLGVDSLEAVALFFVPMLVLAERRITSGELGVLDYLLDSLGANPTPEQAQRFRGEYWQQIAKATHNPLFLVQVRWWRSLARDLTARGRTVGPPTAPVNVELYRALNRALAAHKGAVDVYLASLQPVLDAFDAQRSSTKS